VQSNYISDPVPDSSSSILGYIWLVLLGIIIIGSLIGCIIFSVKNRGTVCEGIGYCCMCFGEIGECLQAFK